jgi:NitT/TauT family transport system substrate-binding protein
MKKPYLFILIIFMVLVSACAPTPTPEPTAVELTPVRLPVGYIPNVQFAPLYVAIEKGYYRDAGLEVDIDYSMENDNTVLTATDEIKFAVVSGEQVLLARAQQMPVVYVMAWYQQFPVGIVAKTSSGITSVSDLQGRKLGLPGLYGASYIGAVAMLDAAGLKESDLTLDSIGYNQVEVLVADKDDAVVIYTANEPNQLRGLGVDIVEFKASDMVELVANGIITNEKTIQEDPELVRSLVSATLKGIEYTSQNPEEAFEICKKYVDNLAEADQEVQMQVLLSSIKMWQSDRLGYSEPASWENMQRILLQMGLLKSELDLNAAYDNSFIPQGD